MPQWLLDSNAICLKLWTIHSEHYRLSLLLHIFCFISHSLLSRLISSVLQSTLLRPPPLHPNHHRSIFFVEKDELSFLPICLRDNDCNVYYHVNEEPHLEKMGMDFINRHHGNLSAVLVRYRYPSSLLWSGNFCQKQTNGRAGINSLVRWFI